MDILEKVDMYLGEAYKITTRDIKNAEKLLSKQNIRFMTDDDEITFSSEKQMINAIKSLDKAGIKYRM